MASQSADGQAEPAGSGVARPGLGDPGAVGPAGLALAQELGLSLTVADALSRRGQQAGESLERFLEPRLAHLTHPDAMAGRQQAVARLADAVRTGERVAVFGDYDCDGITSTAIITETLRALGGRATPLLASRFAGGYGLSEPALGRVLAAEPGLLVTCDCGSADHERIAAARAAGVDVVVIDHHLVPDEPLPATAFVNPHQPECGFAYKGLASCGLALLVATGLRQELDPQLDLRRWLDLVAIGTVADAAPLDGDNRVLVRAGLGVLEVTRRPGLRLLVDRATRRRRLPVTAELIAFQLAPRLNAPGRLGDPMVALELLLSADAVEAAQLAERVEAVLLERRTVQRTMVAEAIAEISRHRYDRDPAMVLAREGWHPGVVGIVAGRLAEQYGKATAVVALEGGTGRGSARAPEGFALYDALERCADELETFGGHQAAAGLELCADRVDSFRARWNEACAATGQAGLGGGQQAEVRLDERDDLMQVVADLEQLEPCGEANPAPVLLVRDVRVRAARPLQDHLKLELDLRGQTLSAFAPNRGSEAAELSGQVVQMLGRLRRDHWRGGRTAELLVEGWVPG